MQRDWGNRCLSDRFGGAFEDMSQLSQVLQGDHQGHVNRLFIVIHGERSLHWKKEVLDWIRDELFPQENSNCNNLRADGHSPSLEVLDKALRNLFGPTLLSGLRECLRSLPEWVIPGLWPMCTEVHQRKREKHQFSETSCSLLPCTSSSYFTNFKPCSFLNK